MFLTICVYQKDVCLGNMASLSCRALWFLALLETPFPLSVFISQISVTSDLSVDS